MTIPDPACMEPDELALWYDGAINLRQFMRYPTLDPCADCLPSFADEMARQGRCNGTPGVSRLAPPKRTVTPARRMSNLEAVRRFRERNPEAMRIASKKYRERCKTLAEPSTVR